MIWCIRFIFSKALGVEAMGLGDADLRMMAGSVLGWQGMLEGFVLGIFVGLFFGVGQMILRGDNMLPFGPSLAIGTMLSCLGWPYFGAGFQSSLFDPKILPIMVVLIAFMMTVAGYILRLIRLARPEH